MTRKVIRREPQSFAADTAHAARVGLVLCCILTGIVWAALGHVRAEQQQVTHDDQ